MNRKNMQNYSSVFLLIAVGTLGFDMISGGKDGVYFVGFMLVMASIYNVGAAIMKKLEEK